MLVQTLSKTRLFSKEDEEEELFYLERISEFVHPRIPWRECSNKLIHLEAENCLYFLPRD